jgi:REP element-mobilizing transposase RayT
MHFPRRIRRDADHYANRDLRFHLTIAAHPELSRFSEPVAEMVWESALEQRTAGRIELFAACLMPDHLHLLVAPNGMDIPRFLDVWKSWTTRQSWKLGHRGGLWQPGVWDRTMRDEDDFMTTARYIIDNPVREGLAERAEDWPHVWAYWFD